MVAEDLCQMHRPPRAIFQKINARSEPVIIVGAENEFFFTRQNPLADLAITTVKREYESAVSHRLAIARCEFSPFCDETVLDQESLGGFWGGGELACSSSHFLDC